MSIRFSSNKSMRAGYISEPAPGGGFIEYPAGIEPDVVWNHIDGPLLYLSNCQLHWLTWRERLALWLGLTTIETINADYVSGRKRDW
jgi:hypothetical protein